MLVRSRASSSHPLSLPSYRHLFISKATRTLQLSFVSRHIAMGSASSEWSSPAQSRALIPGFLSNSTDLLGAVTKMDRVGSVLTALATRNNRQLPENFRPPLPTLCFPSLSNEVVAFFLSMRAAMLALFLFLHILSFFATRRQEPSSSLPQQHQDIIANLMFLVPA